MMAVCPRELGEHLTLGEHGDYKGWINQMMNSESADFSSVQSKRTLYECLLMLTKSLECTDCLQTTGLAGEVQPNDTVYLRGHTGLYIGIKEPKDPKDKRRVQCTMGTREEATPVTVNSGGEVVQDGAGVALHLSSRELLGVPEGGDVHMYDTQTPETQFVVHTEVPGAVLCSGQYLYLLSRTGKYVAVNGPVVRSGTDYRSNRQRLIMEKVPRDSDIPLGCPEATLTKNEEAWLFRRGVQHALIDRHRFATYVSLPRPHPQELIKVYTQMWENEWRAQCSHFITETNPGEVKGRRRSASKSRARRWSFGADRFFCMLSRPGEGIDETNGDLLVDAFRSFFCNAFLLSEMEADPVQRAVESFSAALMADPEFNMSFSQSMLPEAQRTTYKKPEDVLFATTYMTLVINTELHSNAVGKKTFNRKTFGETGKTCGVTAGLMMQIYHNVSKEEL